MQDDAPRLHVADTETPGGVSVSAPVWDFPTRLFHWSLVGLFTAAWLTGGSGNRAHEILGFIITALVIFRVIWGLIGTRHARFSDFVHSPRTILRYLGAFFRLKAPHYRGHNPAGGMMIIFLLLAIATICTSGIMMLTQQFFGVSWVENLHMWAAYGILALIAGHLLGVVLSSWVHQENLVKAMITGAKPAPPGTTIVQPNSVTAINDRMRGMEGLYLITLLAGLGGALGWQMTAHRTSTVSNPDERAPPPEVAPTPIEIAVTKAVQSSSPNREFQDYVSSGPGEASRSWLLSSGGRLYDNWFAAMGVIGPQKNHPSWPANNTAIQGEQTWRCKSCHGWDYAGRDGQYRTGTNATGTIGLQRAKGMPPERIMTILSNDKHGFTDDIMPPHAKYRVALFVSQGQHVVQRYITPANTVNGDLNQGRNGFQTLCAACHGFDGKARRLGASSDPTYKGNPLWVGSKARANPTEVLHKVRNGHPGAIMISLRAFPMDTAVNILAYAQSLPNE
ncbi:MAG: cytochrome b/b6 domain-containing protein [Hyphomicrobiaceae bacterium]